MSESPILNATLKREFLAAESAKRERSTLRVLRLQTTERFPLFSDDTDKEAYYACESSDDIIIELSPVLTISDGIPMLLVVNPAIPVSASDFMPIEAWYNAESKPTPVFAVRPVYEGAIVDRGATTFASVGYKFGRDRLNQAFYHVAQIPESLDSESALLYWRKGKGIALSTTTQGNIETPERVSYTTLSGDTRFIDCSALILYAAQRTVGALDRLARNLPATDKTIRNALTGEHYGARGKYELSRAAERGLS